MRKAARALPLVRRQMYSNPKSKSEPLYHGPAPRELTHAVYPVQSSRGTPVTPKPLAEKYRLAADRDGELSTFADRCQALGLVPNRSVADKVIRVFQTVRQL